MDRRDFLGSSIAALAVPLLPVGASQPNKEVAVPVQRKPCYGRRDRYKDNLELAEKSPFKEFVDEVVEKVDDKFRLSREPAFGKDFSNLSHPDLRIIRWGKNRRALYRQAVILGDVFLKITFDADFKGMVLTSLPPEEMFRIDGRKEGDSFILYCQNEFGLFEFQRTLGFPKYDVLHEPLVYSLTHSAENEAREQNLIQAGNPTDGSVPLARTSLIRYPADQVIHVAPFHHSAEWVKTHRPYGMSSLPFSMVDGGAEAAATNLYCHFRTAFLCAAGRSREMIPR